MTQRLRKHPFLTALAATNVALVPMFSFQEGLSWIPQVTSVLLCLCAFVHYSRQKRNRKPIHPAIVAYVMLTIWFGLPLLFRPMPSGYQTLVKVAVLAVATYVVIDTKGQLLALLSAYALSSMIFVALNSEEIARLHIGASTAVTTEAFADSQRLSGTMVNANDVGMFGVVCLSFAACILFSMRGRARYAIALAVILCSGPITWYSGSRKAMLGSCLIVGAWAGAYGWRKHADRPSELKVIHREPWMGSRARQKRTGRVDRLKGIALCGGGLLLMWKLVSLSPYFIRLAGFGVAGDLDSSGEVRLDMAKTAIRLWLESPVLGHGYQAFEMISGFHVYSHSSPAELLCNGGIVALALYLVFLFIPLRQAIKGGRLCGNKEEWSLYFGIVVYHVSVLFFSMFCVFFNSRDYIPIAAAMCGYLQANNARLRANHVPMWPQPRRGGQDALLESVLTTAEKRDLGKPGQ